jgi:HSP20 family protein
MSLQRWDPYREMRTMRSLMDRFFEEPYRVLGLGEGEEARSMRVDMHETENEVVVEAALPGVKPEDCDISLRDDAITVSGEIKQERKEEEEGQVYLRERYYGKFQRTIPLPSPVDADGAEATFHDGILRVVMPKTEEQKARRISIKSDSEKHHKPEIEAKGRTKDTQ